MREYDVIVIGGGPAGLSAAISADKHEARVLLIERETRLGGILKQCIHDGFGIIRFHERLTGPEYASLFIRELLERKIEYEVSTYVTKIEALDKGYKLTVVNRGGVHHLICRSLVLATGCRERTAKQVFIHGTRPAGVFTAGTAQHYTNLLGCLPSKKCVILGSGDIGLIMARRLTLEGVKVIGVYEAKTTPSGLTRNLVQCLEDYHIPLFLSYTVSRVFGHDRLKAVEVVKLDENMKKIEGSEELIPCDALILSVGLIPENELAESLGIEMDKRTKGPFCDQNFMSDKKGVFICGNALHVNDLVDHVSESGDTAGKAAALYSYEDDLNIDIHSGENLLYVLPQRIRLSDQNKNIRFFFRSDKVIRNATLIIRDSDRELFKKRYSVLKPPEMETVKVNKELLRITKNSVFQMDVHASKD